MSDHVLALSPGALAPERRAARSGWGAVFALTLCVSTLIASEFMPVSILTPIASDLQAIAGPALLLAAVVGCLNASSPVLQKSATSTLSSSSW